ncbi:MAG: NYN domain-containing protein [Streptosporangiales bacterium]|nr:NYN domain-containing protein [Streptosporangiales bacterium]
MTSEPHVPPRSAPVRYAVLIDVGYLYAASGHLLFDDPTRHDRLVRTQQLIEALERHAASMIGGELLRFYWYDAARDRVPTVSQREVAQLPLVKVRLGNLNKQGQQKGVDAQIRSDLEQLARHGAITDAVVVAGDEDLVSAVESAQTYGVRVHLLGVEPPYGTNQAERLVWECDTVDRLDADFIRPYFAYRSDPPEATPAAVPAAAVPAPTAGPDTPKPQPAPATNGSGPAHSGHHAHPAHHERPSIPSPAQVFAGRTGPPTAPTPAVPAPPGPVTPVTAETKAPGPPAPSAARAPDERRMLEVGEHIAQIWLLQRGRDNIVDLLPGPGLPPVIDKDLLTHAERELGRSLRPYQQAREWLRQGFWARLRREFGLPERPPEDTPE